MAQPHPDQPDLDAPLPGVGLSPMAIIAKATHYQSGMAAFKTFVVPGLVDTQTSAVNAATGQKVVLTIEAFTDHPTDDPAFGRARLSVEMFVGDVVVMADWEGGITDPTTKVYIDDAFATFDTWAKLIGVRIDLQRAAIKFPPAIKH